MEANMATKINKAEMDAIVRNGAITALGIAEAGTQIGASTYAIPVETPAEILVAQISLYIANCANCVFYCKT